jgi:putative FmdB family regulatory protein
MPTYEYRCTVCGNNFEQFQRFSDAPVEICPECGGRVRRVLHATGIIFKGSGWYVTDHGRGGRPPENGDGKGEPAAPKEPKEKAAAESASTPASTPSTPSTPASSPAKTSAGSDD